MARAESFLWTECKENQIIYQTSPPLQHLQPITSGGNHCLMLSPKTPIPATLLMLL